MKRWIADFKAVWHYANEQGLAGQRVEVALAAVMPDALQEYSEWLDSEHLIVGDGESDDDRSHEQLVNDFLSERSNG